MRLFVAVLPPPAAVEHLRDAVEKLNVVRAGAGVVRPELWHLTLAFLGEIEDERIEAVTESLASAAAAGRGGTLSLAGGGRFGETVLWVGAEGDVDALGRTARAIRRQLREVRVVLERRPFKPHLTLARPRSRVTREELRADVATLQGYAGPPWDADRVHLMRSTQHRTPEGTQAVTYEPLATWPLE
ncbi:RNA 2',3'-cyclic phosphodiesterase [Cryptosporangium aurantiacum]|uniref:RNA 2',3'-cyclic phosphodiesterase n=1 Tax=Cryptosporangium aurantiacum TaxID=134849 RepID=A0A1M7MZK5_9ACTN|nr:RNA 2',3'-cyclic phosphodiesterase [Cryptosporangium aurantiacum]SHM96623.1 2'-5' RNA ligase [Cryptosporangium aurantiacum]